MALDRQVEAADVVFLTDEPLYRMPAWLLAAGFLALLLGAVEVGFRAGTRLRRRREPQPGADFATIQGAVLGLLGLLLAFTYAFAASRADIRKHNVIEEANAIGTAWLRAGLAAEPTRSELREALGQYLDTRVQSQSVRDAARMDEIVAASEAAQARLWPCVERLVAERPPTVIDSLIVQSINEVIDMHARRLAGFRDRVPEIILAMLALVGMAALGLAGFASGLIGRRNTFFSTTLSLMVVAVTLVIIDLDHPQSGMIRVSQRSLVDLQRELVEQAVQP